MFYSVDATVSRPAVSLSLRERPCGTARTPAQVQEDRPAAAAPAPQKAAACKVLLDESVLSESLASSLGPAAASAPKAGPSGDVAPAVSAPTENAV